MSQSGKLERTVCWRFKIGDDGLALLAKPLATNRADLEQALKLQTELAACGGPVPSLRLTQDGLSDIIKEAGRIWFAMADGGLERESWDRQALSRAGRALGAFHTAGLRLNEQPTPPRGHLPDFLRKAEETVRSLPDSPDAARKRRVLADIQRRMETTRFEQTYATMRKVLIHGDFRDGNVLWKGDSATLVDLELSGSEVPLFDLCLFTCERIRAQHSPWHARHEVFNVLLEGYRHVRPLETQDAGFTELVVLLAIAYRFSDDPNAAGWIDAAEALVS